MIEQSTRIALAAFLHDVGKLAERAGIDHAGRLDAHKTLYCPWHREGGYHSHVHAPKEKFGSAIERGKLAGRDFRAATNQNLTKEIERCLSI